jgi:hypothetical protein
MDSLAAGGSTVGGLRVTAWIGLAAGHVTPFNEFASNSTARNRAQQPESQACPKAL